MSTIAQSVADAARAAAEAAANTQAPAPTAMVPANANPIANATPVRMPSLREAVNAGGAAVDTYLKVTPDGFKLDSDGPILSELTVEIDFAQVVPTLNVRGEAPGGQVIYGRSNNGVTEVNGKPWGQVLADIQRRSSSDKYVEYASYEIPMVLIDEQKKKGSETLKPGAIVGFTPSMMQAKEFAKFFQSTPPDLETRGRVAVKISHEKRKGQGPAYGVIVFELV